MPICSFRASCLLSCCLIPLTLGGAETDWNQFRGPRGDGITAVLHTQVWDDSKHIAWVVDVPGEGWSSPVVQDGRVFVTSAVPLVAGKTGPEPYQGGGGRRRDDLTRVRYEWQVRCYDAEDGKLLWNTVVRTARPTIPRHSSNTYATETPVVSGNRLFVYFGMQGLYCLDLDGNVLWERDLGAFPTRAGWGTSSSPIFYDEKLYVQVDNDRQSFLTAIEAKTGDEVWRLSRDEKTQYSTPYLWKNRLRAELIVGGMVYRSYDPATGDILWQLDMEKGRSSATPISIGDHLYVGTELRNRGGADDGGGFLFSIKPGGHGDISPPPGESSSEFVNWKVGRSGIQMASPAYCNGFLYLLERRSGIVHCLKASDGTTMYRQRIPGARAFWASPWVSGQQVFCVAADGTTYVLGCGRNFQLRATNVIGEQTWTSPAIGAETVFFRTATRLFAIRR